MPPPARVQASPGTHQPGPAGRCPELGPIPEITKRSFCPRSGLILLDPASGAPRVGPPELAEPVVMSERDGGAIYKQRVMAEPAYLKVKFEYFIWNFLDLEGGCNIEKLELIFLK